MEFKCILIILIALVSCVTCHEKESENRVHGVSMKQQPSILSYIKTEIWKEIRNPIPLIISIITYTVLKFTGVLGFLRLLYTIINQSNT